MSATERTPRPRVYWREPRRIVAEDPRELLEQHLMEAEEEFAREQAIEMAALMLDPTNCPEERDIYRWQFGEARRYEHRVRRQNGTLLVLESATYDADACDEQPDVMYGDLEALFFHHGITVPESACHIVAPEELGFDDRFGGGWMPTAEELRAEPMLGESIWGDVG